MRQSAILFFVANRKNSLPYVCKNGDWLSQIISLHLCPLIDRGAYLDGLRSYPLNLIRVMPAKGTRQHEIIMY